QSSGGSTRTSVSTGQPSGLGRPPSRRPRDRHALPPPALARRRAEDRARLRRARAAARGRGRARRRLHAALLAPLPDLALAGPQADRRALAPAARGADPALPVARRRDQPRLRRLRADGGAPAAK